MARGMGIDLDYLSFTEFVEPSDRLQYQHLGIVLRGVSQSQLRQGAMVFSETTVEKRVFNTTSEHHEGEQERTPTIFFAASIDTSGGKTNLSVHL